MKRPHAAQQHLRQLDEIDILPGGFGTAAPPAHLAARWLRDESGKLICQWERR